MNRNKCTFNGETYNCVQIGNNLVVWTSAKVAAKDFLGGRVNINNNTFYVSETTDPYDEPFISGGHVNKGKVAELVLSDEKPDDLINHNDVKKSTRRPVASKRGRVEDGVVIR